MINSRDINELHPKVARMCRDFIAATNKSGIDILITSTYRDKEAQEELYSRGRTAGGRKVTNSKPGFSFHNYRAAFDFVPLVNSEPFWMDMKLFERCGIIAESCGLEWGGRWSSFKDYAHCQYTEGLSISDFIKGRTFK